MPERPQASPLSPQAHSAAPVAYRLSIPQLLIALALPALVWYLGSFFFHGDLGKWIDDYAAHVRDPVTGSFDWSRLMRYQWWFFWRPIHVQLVFFLQTVFYNHVWVNHLFSALMHALACFNLWRFLRVAGVGVPAAAIAAVLLLGAPQASEVIFWPATVSTSIALAAFFWAARIAIRHAQHRHRGPAVLVLALLGFVIPCLYEQPAAALAALPLLYFAAARTSEPRPTIAAAAKRTIMVLVPCGLSVLLYLALFLATVTRDGMARESQFIPADQLLPRLRFLPGNLLGMLDPVTGFGDLGRAGLDAVRGSTLGLGGWCALAVAASFLWMVALRRGRHVPVDSAASAKSALSGSRVPRAALILFALTALVLALIPVFAIRGASLSPRLTYFPIACCLVLTAGLLDGLLALAHRRGAAILAAGAAIAALSGSVVLIGAQSFMRLRHHSDVAALRELRALVPSPPSGCIFIPVGAPRDQRFPASERLGSSFLPIWSSSWAMATEIKHIYSRSDVSAACIYQHNQATAFVRLGEPSMIAWSHYVWHLPTPRLENYCPRFTLAQIVPFTISEDGHVSLVDRITAKHPDGTMREFAFPIARDAASQTSVTARQINLSVPIEDGREWVVGWIWPHKDNKEARFLRVEAWGAADRAVRLHPPTPGNAHPDPDTDALDLPLVQSNSAQRIAFYATFDEPTINLSVLGDGVDLAWTLIGSDGSTQELHRERLDPKETKARAAWTTIAVEIPPLSTPATLRLTALPGPSGNPSYDRVVVTCGEYLSPPVPSKKD